MTATLRQVVEGDLSLGRARAASSEKATTPLVVPPGRKRLLIADPAGVGAATVAALAAGGKPLVQSGAPQSPARPVSTSRSPTRPPWSRLTPERTTVRAAVLLVERGGTAAQSSRCAIRTGLGGMPDVRPGLP